MIYIEQRIACTFRRGKHIYRVKRNFKRNIIISSRHKFPWGTNHLKSCVGSPISPRKALNILIYIGIWNGIFCKQEFFQVRSRWIHFLFQSDSVIIFSFLLNSHFHGKSFVVLPFHPEGHWKYLFVSICSDRKSPTVHKCENQILNNLCKWIFETRPHAKEWNIQQ